MARPAPRDAKGRLLPGAQLNPGGRVPSPEHVKRALAAAATASEPMIMVLVGIAQDPGEDAGHRIAAAKAVIDRVLPKPILVGEDPANRFGPEAVDRIRQRILGMAITTPPPPPAECPPDSVPAGMDAIRERLRIMAEARATAPTNGSANGSGAAHG